VKFFLMGGVHIGDLGLEPMIDIAMMLFTTKFSTSLAPLIPGPRPPCRMMSPEREAEVTKVCI
jgi:hypothetical protein